MYKISDVFLFVKNKIKSCKFMEGTNWNFF